MEPIPYRIRIGVTGHRVLDNETELKQQIIEILKTEITKLFDNNSLSLLNKNLATPVTYSVLTPLAEGADRLIAETVMEYDALSCVEVILPLTLPDYKKTFNNPDDPEFFELYAKARHVRKLRYLDLENDPKINQNTSETNIENRLEKAREEAFEKAGRHIVNHCDVLIAIWDGEKSQGIGGTQDIIEYANTKNRPVIIISTNPPYTIKVEKGYGLNCHALKGIERFNNTSIPSTVKDSYTKNMYDKLFQNPESNYIPESSKEIVREILLPYYVKASIKAKKYQRIYMPSGILIFLCSAIAVAAVLIGILYHPVLLFSFLVEFLCLLTILTICLFAQQLRINWLENRFLTERLRAACYFIATSTEITSIEIPPYMGVAHKYSDWMVLVFNEIWYRTPKMEGIKDDMLNCFKDYIIKHWIDDQKNHHSEKHRKLTKLNKRFAYFGWVIYLIALIASGIHIVQSLSTGFELDQLTENILIFLAIALPALGAAVVGIRKHGEYERIESRSYNMSEVIEDISIDFNKLHDKNEFVSLMYDLDKLMLLENQDWLMLMKLVKLEVNP
ncbi:MAG: hypothetical protein HQ565_07805 [Bacteroidetes bacterium]|nr:hypothetical protein [Bacteroidota bacterium]